MADPVKLKIANVDQERNEVLVGQLESVLEMARAGTIQNVVIVGFRSDDSYATWITPGVGALTHVGVLESMKLDILSHREAE